MQRRPPGRPPLPPRRRPAGRGPRPPRRLIRANALMEEGRHREAAEILVRLSAAARRRGMPGRAAHLAIRASHAFLADGSVHKALEVLHGALRLLLRQGQVKRAAHVVSRSIKRLRDSGFENEAAELQRRVEKLRQDLDIHAADWEAPPARIPQPARSSLPESCTGCGAPLAPDEVIWHQAQKAECPYCGSIISAR